MAETTALTPAEKVELAKLEAEELELSSEGIDFKPARYKINKDTQQFVDPFGNAHDELRGVIVYKEKARGHWCEGEKNPLCSSIGGMQGVDRDGKAHDCLKCPHNQWGSGKGGSGKACKEMRRVYLVQRGGQIPLMFSLPPTSISGFDAYISARIQQGTPDLMAEAVFRLVPGQSDQGFTYAVIKPSVGERITDIGEIMQLRKVRELMKAAAARTAVTDEDYSVEQPEDKPEDAPAEGDVF